MKKAALTTALVAALAFAAVSPAQAAGEFDPYAVTSGSNLSGQRNLPAIPDGTTLVKAAVGADATWLLLSNGTVTTTLAATEVPALPAGMTYTDIAAWGSTGVLLRSDGQLVYSGEARVALPAVPAGARIAKIFGGVQLVAILDDGRATTFRYFDDGDDDLPPVYVAKTTSSSDYVAATSGIDFVLLLTDGGKVRGVNTKDPNPDDCEDGNDSCDPNVDPAGMTVPKLTGSQTWVSISANATFVVYVRSDGAVKVTGDDRYLHPLLRFIPDGVRYVKAAVGTDQAAFLLSNGDTYITGRDRGGRGNLVEPTIAKGNRFIDVAAGGDTNVFIAQKLTPNVKVQTSITRVSIANPVTTGKTGRIQVKVYSMAATRGGIIKVTYKNKVIGTAAVGDGAIANVTVSTTTMAKGKNKIGIAFMGIGNAKKSLSNTRWVGTFRTK